MRKALMRPTHFTFHREGPAPRFRLLADEPAARVRVELAAQARLLAPANAAERTADTYFDSEAGSAGVPAQQLQLVGGKLTYDLPNPVWDRLKAATHVFHRITATAQLPVDWTAAAPRTVRSVDDGWAASGRATYFGVVRDPLGDPWNFPDQEPLGQVPAYYRARLTQLTRYPESNENAYMLRRLAGEANYASLPVAQRTRALLVYAATDTPGRRALLQLFGRNIPPVAAGGTASPAVRSTDLSAAHATLLDNLAQLAETDAHLDIPDPMNVLVAEAVEEVADPLFELNQGTKGTCVPTSVSWIVATYFPAEYVRLAVGLLGTAGAARLANGDQASTPADSYRFDAAEDATTVASFLRRSWTERLFQAAMMSYSRPGLTYSNITDVFADRRGGLTADELCRLLRGLRNRAHQAVSGTGADLVSNIARRLAGPSLPVLTAMRWGTGSHEVVSLQASDAEITFRNPWGGMNYRVGQVLASPPRRCVNPSWAEEAIARSDLSAAILSIVVES